MSGKFSTRKRPGQPPPVCKKGQTLPKEPLPFQDRAIAMSWSVDVRNRFNPTLNFRSNGCVELRYRWQDFTGPRWSSHPQGTRPEEGMWLNFRWNTSQQLDVQFTIFFQQGNQTATAGWTQPHEPLFPILEIRWQYRPSPPYTAAGRVLAMNINY